jgi:hypothetical protein
MKFKFIEEQASKGNVLAKQYLEKLRKEEVSIDWAHRVLIGSIRQQRMLKMMATTANILIVNPLLFIMDYSPMDLFRSNA